MRGTWSHCFLSRGQSQRGHYRAAPWRPGKHGGAGNGRMVLDSLSSALLIHFPRFAVGTCSCRWILRRRSASAVPESGMWMMRLTGEPAPGDVCSIPNGHSPWLASVFSLRGGQQRSAGAGAQGPGPARSLC